MDRAAHYARRLPRARRNDGPRRRGRRRLHPRSHTIRAGARRPGHEGGRRRPHAHRSNRHDAATAHGGASMCGAGRPTSRFALASSSAPMASRARWVDGRESTRAFASRDMESCAQYVVDDRAHRSRRDRLHFGDRVAPGGYAWVFPKGAGAANVGLGVLGLRAGGRSASRGSMTTSRPTSLTRPSQRAPLAA